MKKEFKPTIGCSPERAFKLFSEIYPNYRPKPIETIYVDKQGKIIKPPIVQNGV